MGHLEISCRHCKLNIQEIQLSIIPPSTSSYFYGFFFIELVFTHSWRLQFTPIHYLNVFIFKISLQNNRLPRGTSQYSILLDSLWHLISLSSFLSCKLCPHYSLFYLVLFVGKTVELEATFSPSRFMVSLVFWVSPIFTTTQVYIFNSIVWTEHIEKILFWARIILLHSSIQFLENFIFSLWLNKIPLDVCNASSIHLMDI